MKGLQEEIVTLAESGEVKVKTANPQEMAFAVHKGSYQQLGEVFWKLVQWVEENGYGIVGYSETVCYNDPHTTPEGEMVRECQFPMRKRR
jgi:effector-binding domain-containing protein